MQQRTNKMEDETMDQIVALYNQYVTDDWPELRVAHKAEWSACNYLARITQDDTAHCHDTWECTWQATDA